MNQAESRDRKRQYNESALRETIAWLSAKAGEKRKWLDFRLSIERAREQMRNDEYVPNPFLTKGQDDRLRYHKPG